MCVEPVRIPEVLRGSRSGDYSELAGEVFDEIVPEELLNGRELRAMQREYVGPAVYLGEGNALFHKELFHDAVIVPEQMAGLNEYGLILDDEIKNVLLEMGLDFGMKVDSFDKKYQEWKRKQHHEA